jgi:hypothetical protein
MCDFIEDIQNGKVKHGSWSKIENHKKYAIWLGKKLGYTKMEHWYNITLIIICDNYGSGLLYHKYNGSPSLFIKSVFPEYHWLDWKFGKTNSLFWKNIDNQKRYVVWLGETLGYTKMEDWYRIKNIDISENFGSGLMNYYKRSPFQLIITLFPEYNWIAWRFISGVPQNYWRNRENQINYANWLGETLGYTKMEDWYNITRKLIIQNAGSGILAVFNGSPFQFVKSIFPEYNWLEWKFMSCTPNGFWKNIDNQKRYAVWLGETLGYTKLEDWYNITRELLITYGGIGLVGNYYSTSHSRFLQTVFPDFKWDLSKFTKKYSNGQIEWLEYLKVSIPDIRHILNNSNGEFKIPNTKYNADGYSENQKYVFEYHGDFWHGNPEIFNLNDINPVTKKSYGDLYNNTLQKQKVCQDNGYKYYSIWESNWLRGIKSIRILQQKFRVKSAFEMRKGV